MTFPEGAPPPLPVRLNHQAALSEEPPSMPVLRFHMEASLALVVTATAVLLSLAVLAVTCLHCRHKRPLGMMTSSARSHDGAQTPNVTLFLFVLQCPSDRSPRLSRSTHQHLLTNRINQINQEDRPNQTIWLFHAVFSVIQSGHLSSESFIHVSVKLCAANAAAADGADLHPSVAAQPVFCQSSIHPSSSSRLFPT